MMGIKPTVYCFLPKIWFCPHQNKLHIIHMLNIRYLNSRIMKSLVCMISYKHVFFFVHKLFVCFFFFFFLNRAPFLVIVTKNKYSNYLIFPPSLPIFFFFFGYVSITIQSCSNQMCFFFKYFFTEPPLPSRAGRAGEEKEEKKDLGEGGKQAFFFKKKTKGHFQRFWQ